MLVLRFELVAGKGRIRTTLGDAIETFLRFDAYPFLWLRCETPLPDQCWVVQFIHGAERWIDQITLQWHIDFKLTNYLSTEDREVSLADLVVYLELENTKTILGLVDKNMSLHEKKRERAEGE